MQSAEKTDAKQAARLASLTAKEMSTDCTPEGEGDRWADVTNVISLFASGNQKPRENTRVYTHMLHEGKGWDYCGLFLGKKKYLFSMA